MQSIAIYSRISTSDQDHDSQESVIRQWLESSGIPDDRVDWYRDTESGDTMARASMKLLEKAIFDGKVKTVVVYKLDRISRNMLDGLSFMASACEKGCRVVSVTQAIDVTGTMGRIIAAVLLGFAEIEQQTRRDRQRAGIDAARKKGKLLGRKAGTVKGKPDRVKELRAQGLTVEEVMTATGLSRATVFRYLSH